MSQTFPACSLGGWSDASDMTEMIEITRLKN
jgi:hypothetical protein